MASSRNLVSTIGAQATDSLDSSITIIMEVVIQQNQTLFLHISAFWAFIEQKENDNKGNPCSCTLLKSYLQAFITGYVNNGRFQKPRVVPSDSFESHGEQEFFILKFSLASRSLRFD